MDDWVPNDELSSISLQPLIVTEGAVDLQPSRSAPGSSHMISTSSSDRPHISDYTLRRCSQQFSV